MAKYSVFILPSAQKEIRNLPKPVQGRILKAIAALAETPRPVDCKKLVGSDSWRVRVAEYRIVYHLEDSKLLIEIVRVAHRKEGYR